MIKVPFEDSKPSPTSKVMYKVGETMTSFILEDCAQVGLQYFYFEKYQFRESIIITFITIFMELKRTSYDKSINNASTAKILHWKALVDHK